MPYLAGPHCAAVHPNESHVEIVLALTPWALPFVYLAVRLRLPPELPQPRGHGVAGTAVRPRGVDAVPFVSVIVPARNEALNIETCLRSLTTSTYPDFEIIVVDDRSRDRTAELARGVPQGNARGSTVLSGHQRPAGWFGKPWACAQGAREAQGDLLLFTDADTIHAPDLLGRAVAGLERENAGALTVLGSQLMETFWERLIQPQVFALLFMRFPNPGRARLPNEWRQAIANGQFLLFRREVYEDLGGHEVVAGEVVEDLRFAQELVRAGHRLSVRNAEGSLSTRMYRSLGDLVEGWSKNLWTAAQQSAPVWARGLVVPAALVVNTILWIVPPLVLVGVLGSGAFGPAQADVFAWASGATALGFLFWTPLTARLGTSPSYGLLYPLGMAVVLFIMARSWLRGTRITWKGRTYGDESS